MASHSRGGSAAPDPSANSAPTDPTWGLLAMPETCNGDDRLPDSELQVDECRACTKGSHSAHTCGRGREYPKGVKRGKQRLSDDELVRTIDSLPTMGPGKGRLRRLVDA